MAGGGQVSAGAIPPIVTRVGKEVDALDGGEDFEGGLGVGREPLLVWGAGLPKPFCLQPSLRGGGARSWGKAIEHRRRCHQDEPGMGRCSSCLPSDYQFLCIAT